MIVAGAKMPLQLWQIRAAAELLIPAGEDRDKVTDAVDSAYLTAQEVLARADYGTGDFGGDGHRHHVCRG